MARNVCKCLNELDSISNIEVLTDCFQKVLERSQKKIDFKVDPESPYPEYLQGVILGEKIYFELQSLLIQKCTTYYDFWLSVLNQTHEDIKLAASQERLESISLLLDGNYSSEFLAQRGTVYMGLNKLDSAINDFNEALRINPNNIKAAYFSGWIYELKKDYEKAKVIYNGILNQSSDPEALVLVETLNRRLREIQK